MASLHRFENLEINLILEPELSSLACIRNKLSHASVTEAQVCDSNPLLFLSVPPSTILDPKFYWLLSLSCSFKLGNEKNHPFPNFSQVRSCCSYIPEF